MLGETIDILLIDDDEDDFVIVKDLLSDIKTTHFNIKWESDYEKALGYIHEQCFDIYLIDFRLGEMNGLELLREAVVINRGKPVIMLTGQGEPEVDYEAMQIGAADYLVKDAIDAQSIERSIRYALSNAHAVSKLYEQEKKYRALFEQSLNAIFITDSQQQIVDANPAMLSLFGYNQAEMLQSKLFNLFVREEDYRAFQQQIVAEGHVLDMEVLLKNKKAKEVFCNISVTQLFEPDRKEQGYQGIIEDITERKKVQLELIQLEKLIMTGNIARSIAHEVRNPLTNINLALEQFTFEATEDDTLEVYLEIIKRNTKRINQLITEMLKSSKPSTLNLKPTSLNNVLETSLRLASDRLKLQEIKVIKLFDQELEEIPLDLEKLSMAFLNVITNAIEAVEPKKGIVTLKTRKIGKFQVVQICDNGPGIEQDEIKKLFDAFHTGKKGGMGLGLTSTQNIVNAHGAKISVDSTLNKGTCFTFTFNRLLDKLTK
ncbi:hybrid sensor histidine kinase/response regulator [Catalinimonas niigatensis]|uniref:hybrid sensor histidine kinase/response regulator n=1 Tax=Catalinimonas niigatensis TaxID=1397264 RepID=UPI002666A3A0|nr:hybrid sensor histidine kinase/response regulator [Catalinimonas niigatensis]WPP51488.1 PAS domain S-box protein [Catalinimonas niigatensis]